MDFDRLYKVIESRKAASPEESYTASLFERGNHAIAAKLIEEANETAAAALREGKKRLIEEAADLIYHLLVLLASNNVTLDDIREELARRHR